MIFRLFWIHNPELQGLELISEHTSVRGNEDEGDSDMFHPRYLPRAEILRLLVDVIEGTEGVAQQAAVKALIDAAACASGAGLY